MELVCLSAYVLITLSETRWSARHDAVKTLKFNYPCVIETLKIWKDDTNQTRDTRSEAENIMNKLSELDAEYAKANDRFPNLQE